ncbi:MAG: protein kinase [Phycisphaerales bacterium]|nr:protein kinase [Phycisphaerales bacterium]MCB9855310.1 protein kinase [Phycisphaerales bacterium]MCB9862903.1 protein kinase [Phycisphaerales bacterium]
MSLDAGATIPDRASTRPAGVDRYEIRCGIGAGGMGQVFLAKDRNLAGRWVAVKRLSTDLMEDARARMRFDTEAETIARLSHHHIVNVFERGEDKAGPYIAMEYIAGPSDGKTPPPAGWEPDCPSPPLNLFQHVRNNGPLAPEDVIQLGIKLASALKYAHDRSIIHRDVKPGNVLLDEELEPRLVDFGLARETDGQSKFNTMPGAQMRSFGFGAPEQERDASKVDHRADIYGLAATLWFALSGESAEFFRESEVPVGLRSVLVRALKRDPDQRFDNVADLRAALQSLSGGRPVFETTIEAPPGYWQCLNCGQFNRDASRHCEKCGEGSLLKCPQCGQETRRGVAHCGHCGIHLEQFIHAENCLRLAEESAGANHLEAAHAILARISSESGAHAKQMERAERLRSTLSAEIGDRKAIARRLRESNARKAWDENAASMLVKLRKIAPKQVQDPEWDVVPADATIPEEIATLDSDCRRVMRGELEAALENKDLAILARVGPIAVSAFPNEDWTRGELTQGAVLRAKFHEDVNKIAQRLRDGAFASIEDYQRAKEVLDDAMTWSGHEDPQTLATMTEQINEALRKLPALSNAWNSGKISAQQLVELWALTPANDDLSTAARNAENKHQAEAQRLEQSGAWDAALKHWELADLLSTHPRGLADKCTARRESALRALAESTIKSWPARAYWAGMYFTVLFFAIIATRTLFNPPTWVEPAIWAGTGFFVGLLHCWTVSAILKGRSAFIPILHAISFGGAAYLVGNGLTPLSSPFSNSLALTIFHAGAFASVLTLLLHIGHWREYARIWPILIAWVFILPLGGYLLQYSIEGFRSIAAGTVELSTNIYASRNPALLVNPQSSLIYVESSGLSNNDQILFRGVRAIVLSLSALVAGLFAGIVFMNPAQGQISAYTQADRPYRRLLPRIVTVLACWVFLVFAFMGDPGQWIVGGFVIGFGVALSRILLGSDQVEVSPRQWGREILRALLTIACFCGMTIAAVSISGALAEEVKFPRELDHLRRIVIMLLLVSAIGFVSFLVSGKVNAQRMRTMFALPVGWLFLAMISAGLYGLDWSRSGGRALAFEQSWIPALVGAFFAGSLIVSSAARRESKSCMGPFLATASILVIASVAYTVFG